MALRDALVWVDCEMTGLGGEGGPGDDRLVQVAVLVTDKDLNVIAEGPELTIHHSDEVLDGMSDWCKTQFGWNGLGQPTTKGRLAEAIQQSSISEADADAQILQFVQQYMNKNVGVLAGNTVHMDKRFLDKYCPMFMGHLHYRIVDVSTLKELCRRWYPEDFSRVPPKKCAHTAMADIKESLLELRYYREAVFKGV